MIKDVSLHMSSKLSYLTKEVNVNFCHVYMQGMLQTYHFRDMSSVIV